MAKTIIKTDAEALLPELRKALLVVPKTTPMPILENFLFDFKKGKSFVIANNISQFYKTKIEASAEEEISFITPAYLFTELVGSLSGPLSIEVQKTKAIIKSSNGQYSLSISQEINDYPEQPKPKKNEGVVYEDVPKEIFLHSLEEVEYAISKEDLRPAMCGVLIEPDKKVARFVSTDGHQLSLRVAEVEAIGEGEGFIIPSDSLSIIKKICPEKIKLTINKSYAFINNNEFEFATRLIGEKYPKYEAVIPKENDKEMEIGREEFIKTIKRLMLFKEEKGGQIVLSFEKDCVVMNVQNATIGSEGTEKIEVKHNLPNDFVIGFNPKYLVDTANSFGSEKIKMTFSNPGKACLMLDPEKPKNISLVMPARVTETELK